MVDQVTLFERWHWSAQEVGELEVEEFQRLVSQAEKLYELEREANR